MPNPQIEQGGTLLLVPSNVCAEPGQFPLGVRQWDSAHAVILSDEAPGLSVAWAPDGVNVIVSATALAVVGSDYSVLNLACEEDAWFDVVAGAPPPAPQTVPQARYLRPALANIQRRKRKKEIRG
jgi:hypothetical protein